MKISVPPADVISEDALLAWLANDITPDLAGDKVNEYYLTMHPRMNFFKNLPKKSILFDIGAGTGNLIGFREWIVFKREDLQLVGASLEHGQKTGQYAEFLLGDIETMDFNFNNNKPNAAFMAHFIEHLKDPARFLARLRDYLPQGSRVYIEWPSAHTVDLPRLKAIRAAGYNLSTINFYDDYTHVNAYPLEQMAEMATNAGFNIVSAGFVDMPFLAENLKYYGIKDNDNYLLTMAVWLKTLFSSYLTLTV